MSWLDDLHAKDPTAWEAMNDAGRIPPPVADEDDKLAGYLDGLEPNVRAELERSMRERER